ncbi:GntR family transcriptional regulator [Streptomyces europaeiscabiei]|uniref:MarR family transcriptional regulator n=1 Tax=Streptomyces europaeiscabiei TaxID=146819 RepID=UPI0029A08B9D|nr:MarR family transcriptional regulator [Streptomyces europaeiscabiei]MDX3712758.1 GntR family transcriptional regulator [Streptomyces europaeiscabiei]
MNAQMIRDLIHAQDLKPSVKVVGVHMVLQPQAQTASEIAVTVGLHRTTVGEALLRLAEDGWVSRTHHLWVGEAR